MTEPSMLNVFDFSLFGSGFTAYELHEHHGLNRLTRSTNQIELPHLHRHTQAREGERAGIVH